MAYRLLYLYTKGECRRAGTTGMWSKEVVT
jgi:hypothetical protein